MKNDSKTSFIEVLSGVHWKGSLIQQLLSDHDIHSFLRNEFMGSIDHSQLSLGAQIPFQSKYMQTLMKKRCS